MSGLGGIGKTQIAVEYAYCYAQEYQVVLWVQGESQETLQASYGEIASLLNLPEKEAQEQGKCEGQNGGEGLGEGCAGNEEL